MKKRMQGMLLGVLVIALNFVVLMTSTTVYASQSAGWLSLNEIQNRQGVYIKRDNRFLPLQMNNIAVTTANNTLAITENTNSVLMLPGDRIVYVNLHPPRLTISTGFMGYLAGYPFRFRDTAYFYSANIVENVNAHIQFATPNNDAPRYTYLNGHPIPNNPLLETNVLWPENRNMFGGLTRGIRFIGDRGDRFTLGRWQGTNWIETVIVAENRRIYTAEQVATEIERTLNGYFYLNFEMPSEGYMLVAFSGYGQWNASVQSLIRFGGGVAQVPRPITPAPTGRDSLRFIIGTAMLWVGGTSHPIEAAPFIADGRTMLPLRVVSETLGASVEWDGATQTISIQSDDTELLLTIDTPLPNNMGTPQLVDGNTFVPVAYVAEMLGATVRWDGDAQAVYIYTASDGISPMPTSPSEMADDAVLPIGHFNTTFSTLNGHSMAIDSTGTLWGWGNNSYGQIGDGTTINRSTPVRIMGNVVSVITSFDTTMTITANGVLYAWGANPWGRLGDGTTQERHTPTRIMDNVAFAYNSMGSNALAISTDGSLWVWGLNSEGVIGDGTREHRYTPTRVKDNVVFAYFSGGGTHAVTADNHFLAWGQAHIWTSEGSAVVSSLTPETIPLITVSHFERNTVDDISIRVVFDGGGGHGTSISLQDGIPRGIPQEIGGSTVIAVSPGFTHTLALTAEGVLWAWGENTYGQLGDGTTQTRTDFVRVMDNVMIPNQ
ncbi:MAG: stalk domain-containing protein [Defluviitaleaceae bacterium]|nr:stalk domain-containing protein [Defluviitaleaceae bacterium]